ncbi:MAG: hypothetical protein U1F11_00215 [Steroidobacteraceae bacterium]
MRTVHSARRAGFAALFVLAGFAAAVPVHADGCNPAGQVVVQANGTKVAIYSKEGEYLAEVDKALVVTGVPILACDARTDHVLVRLTDQRAVWVDRLEVEVRSAQAAKARECKDTGVARPADQTTPATSGIDPCRH